MEAALVLPVLLAVTLAGADVARFGAQSWAAQRAAGTVADWIAMHSGDDPAGITTAELARAGCSRATIERDDDTGIVVVTVSCPFVPVSPLPWPSTLTASAPAAIL